MHLLEEAQIPSLLEATTVLSPSKSLQMYRRRVKAVVNVFKTNLKGPGLARRLRAHTQSYLRRSGASRSENPWEYSHLSIISLSLTIIATINCNSSVNSSHF
jgi:hypothetical protein